MRKEVSSAVDFITNMLRNRLNQNKMETFSQCLNNLLISHYQNHWFPDKPNKGSGYRCIRINHKMDPLISQAGAEIGLAEKDLFDLFPSELTLWVDPADVSYRIGEDGSIGVLFDTPTSDSPSPLDDTSSSDSSSAYSSDDDSQGFHSQQHQMNMDFWQACKDQFRYYLPETSHHQDMSQMNFEQYLTTFVAS